MQTARIADLLRLMIAENGRFPEFAEFYYREVLQRALKAIERLAAEGRNSGELATDALVRFPQRLGAPIALTLVWGMLFERFRPLDRRALIGAYLDLVFGPAVGRDAAIKGDMTDEKAWALDERFWLEGPSVYKTHLDPACLMAFPGIGTLRAAEIADAVQHAPRWEVVDMTDRRISGPTAGLILLGYTGKAAVPGSSPIVASVRRPIGSMQDSGTLFNTSRHQRAKSGILPNADVLRR